MNDLMNRLGSIIGGKLFDGLCSVICDEVSKELALQLQRGVNEELGYEFYNINSQQQSSEGCLINS